MQMPNRERSIPQEGGIPMPQRGRSIPQEGGIPMPHREQSMPEESGIPMPPGGPHGNTRRNGPPRRQQRQQFARAPNAVSAVPTLSPLYKTRPCRFFEAGMCRAGPLCSFAHGEDDMRPPPDFECTSICPVMLRDGHCNAPFCRYAHRSSELQKSPVLLKTKLCTFFFNDGCVVGDACRFAHSVEELQESALVQQDALIAVAMAMAAGAPGQIPGSGQGFRGDRVRSPQAAATSREARRASFLASTLPSGRNRSASARARGPKPNEVPLPTGAQPRKDKVERKLPLGRTAKLIAKNTFVSVVESDTSDTEPTGSCRRARSQ